MPLGATGQRRQCPNDGRFGQQLAQAVGGFQRIDHALQIGAQIVQGGRGHFHFKGAHGRFDLQLARLRRRLAGADR